ncbi:MAG: hypothetical protein AB7F35_22540 [Acetobacteraceae bacterium]
MDAYIYGEKRALPDGFQTFGEPARSAVVSIDMHQGHLADTPDCPFPAPRRAGENYPMIHVRTVLRKGGIDDLKGHKAAWRLVFPLYAGTVPNADEHGIEGTRWTKFIDARRPGRHDGQHQEAAFGLLSD